MNGRPYTNREIQYLVENYALAGAEACAKALGRTVASVKTAASTHKEIPSPTHKWTETDLETLREHYPRKGAKIVAAMIGTTYRSVQRRAQMLGVKYLGPEKCWRRRCRCCGVWKHVSQFTPTGRQCEGCRNSGTQAMPGTSRKYRRQLAAARIEKAA